MVKTQKASSYREEAQKILLSERVKPVSGPVELSLTVYRQRNRGDIDNVLKAVLDACTGFLYEDDEQICRLTITRDKDAKNPRVEVERHDSRLE